MPTTLEPQEPIWIRLWGYHPLRHSFPGISSSPKKVQLRPHHIFLTFQIGIQFTLIGFRSPLLTESQLISLPVGTKMFQFPTFPLLPEQFGNPRFKGCLRLAEAYHGLPCPSSAIKPSHSLYGLINTLSVASYLYMVSFL